MKHYLLGLDDEDNRIRTALLKRYEKKHGRPISFAEIVRTIMRKEFTSTQV